MAVALEVDHQHLVRRDHQPVDLPQHRPAADGAADRLLRPAARPEHRRELRLLEDFQHADRESRAASAGARSASPMAASSRVRGVRPARGLEIRQKLQQLVDDQATPDRSGRHRRIALRHFRVAL